MIQIRPYRQGEEEALWRLVRQTLRHVNIKDYSQDQIGAWVPDKYDPSYWVPRIQGINPFVALIDDQIVGYADLQAGGLIDHFFCHHAYQRKGVGTSLMEHLLSEAKRRKISRLYAYVSITARPFFEHFGFQFVEENREEIRGQILINYTLEKIL